MGSTFNEGEVGASQSATFVVAASDSLHQGYADYVCDGTDDQVEIQAAIDALPISGGEILLLDGIFTFTSAVNLKSNVSIKGQGKSTVIHGSFHIVGSETATTTTLTLDASCDGVTLNVNDASGFIAGDFIKIEDSGTSESPPGTGSSYGGHYEGAIIRSIVGNAITLEAGLSNNYTVGNGAVITKVTPVEYCSIERLSIVQTLTGDLIYAYWIKGVTINHCWFAGNLHQGIYAATSLRGTFRNCYFNLAHDAVNIEISALYNTIDNCISEGSNGNGVDVALHSLHNTISNCKIMGVSSETAISIEYYCDYNVISNCVFSENSVTGVSVTYHSNYNVISDCIIKDNLVHITSRGIYILDSSYIDIHDNMITNNSEHGILLSGLCKHCLIHSNIVRDNGQAGGAHTQDGIVFANGYANMVYDNDVSNSPRSEIRMHASPSSSNKIFGNRVYGTHDDAITDNGIHNTIYDQHSDLFMDVLAASTTHVRSNEDLAVATPFTFTIDAQPDVPRTLSGHFDTHANITAYTIDIVGVDAKGNSITETKTEADGWDWETNNAFAIITSITMSARTGTGESDTMDIGITDVLGLSNKIYATEDVFKIKKNNADATIGTVNPTYGTVDCSTITGGDDFTIWYKSNLNIIS